MAEAEKKRDQTFSQVIIIFPKSSFISFTPNLVIYHHHHGTTPTFCYQSLHPHFTLLSLSLSLSLQSQILIFPFLRFERSDIMVISQDKDEEKYLDLGHDEHESPLPLTVTSRVNFSDPRFCSYV